MSAANSRRNILGALCGLIVCLFWFELTPFDMFLQQLLFDSNAQQWVWSRTEPVTRLLVYDGPRACLVVLGAGLVIGLIVARFSPALSPYTRQIRIVLLSLALLPGSVGLLKNVTNVACPRNLVQFGGEIEYVGILGAYSPRENPVPKQRCFPAGHASGGFALLSISLLFKSRRNRRQALFATLALGWTMGIYKMLIGDHFISHTVTTMLLAWLIVHAIVLVDIRLFPRDLIALEIP